MPIAISRNPKIRVIASIPDLPMNRTIVLAARSTKYREHQRQRHSDEHCGIDQAEVVRPDTPDLGSGGEYNRDRSRSCKAWHCKRRKGDLEFLWVFLARSSARRSGEHIRNPITEMIKPPATRSPGTDMPKKSMIAAPIRRKVRGSQTRRYTRARPVAFGHPCSCPRSAKRIAEPC